MIFLHRFSAFPPCPKTTISTFHFERDRGPARKPAMADGASILNIVNILNLFIIGHDVMTAQQLKEAIDSYGGVRGCWEAVVEVNTKRQTTGTHKISGISQLNNFQYTQDGGVIVWKAFRVGEGKRISKQELSKMGRPIQRAIQG